MIVSVSALLLLLALLGSAAGAVQVLLCAGACLDAVCPADEALAYGVCEAHSLAAVDQCRDQVREAGGRGRACGH